MIESDLTMKASKRLLAVVGLLLGVLVGWMAFGGLERTGGDAVASDRVVPRQQVVQPRREIPILTAFVNASASGEYEKVRALFTKDGIFTTVSNVHSQLYHKKIVEPGLVDTKDFRDLVGIHLGQRMKVVGTPIQVGDNTVAFGWAWPDGIRGTGMFHLRKGKIVFAIVQPIQYPLPFGG